MRNVQKWRAMGKTTKLHRTLDEVSIFLAATAFVALLVATYGLDLSPGLF